MKTETLQIEGMSCGHCVKAVRQALDDLDGVEVRNVEIGTAEVSYDPAVVDPKQIDEAIDEAGYTVLAHA